MQVRPAFDCQSALPAKGCSFLLSFLLLLLAPVCTKAQPASNSFSWVSTITHPDTAKINALNRYITKLTGTHLDSARLLAERSLQMSQNIRYAKGQADARLALTAIYQNLGAYLQATQNGLQALNIYETIHATANKAATCLALAQVYKDMSGHVRTADYTNSAIRYSQQANRLYASVADTAGMVNALSMEGTLNRDIGKRDHDSSAYQRAFSLFTKGIALVKTTNQGTQYLSKLYNNISQVYSEHFKNYRAALHYLFEAVAINTANHNIISLSYNYGNISQNYINLKKPDSGLVYARVTLDMAEQTGRPNRLINAYSSMSNAHKKVGNYDSALFYYTQMAELNDSLNSVAKTRQVAELQTQYETAQKESQIRLLDTENKNKNGRIALLGAGLVIFVILAIALIALYQRVQHQKKELSSQANRLEVMMKELHHRVKNNLQIVSSLLNMQLYKLRDEESISALKASSERVQAMSLIHQRLYKKDELTAINLREYLADLARSLMHAYGYTSANFTLEVQVQQEVMDADTALPIGLIVNELITNCLKYAYKDVIRPYLGLHFFLNDHQLVLQVKDNGTGFDMQQWQHSSGSFGKQLLLSLCRQLRASHTISTDNGTTFTIVLPSKTAGY